MILRKKEIGQTVSNRFKAAPYLFKFKPFSHLENCQTVANRFAKILEILVAKPSNRHEPPRQSVAKSPRAIACNCEPRHVFPSCQKSDAWNGYGESIKIFLYHMWHYAKRTAIQTEPGPHLNRFFKACKAHGRPSIPKIKPFQTVPRPVALIALSNRFRKQKNPKPFQTVFGKKKS